MLKTNERKTKGNSFIRLLRGIAGLVVIIFVSIASLIAYAIESIKTTVGHNHSVDNNGKEQANDEGRAESQ